MDNHNLKAKAAADLAAAFNQKPPVEAADKEPDEFAGLTQTNCCDACTAEKCVISGRPACAHPLKVGLQAGLINNPQALATYKRSARYLKRQILDREDA